MSSESPSSGRWGRVLLVGAVLTAALVAWRLGVVEALTVPNLRAWAERSGWWGPVVFIGLFAVGEVLHVPSVVFVVVAGIVWPIWIALPTAYLGAMAASATVFLFARYLVGAGLRRFVHEKLPVELRRYDDALEARGIRTVATIRFFTFMAPLMHWVLATSRVRFVPMMIGTAIGLLPAITALVFLGEQAIEHWERARPFVYAAIALFVVVQLVRWLRRRRAAARRVETD